MPNSSAADLTFALCHEISNLVGAVRLHAHLIDDDMGPRELATAAVQLDDLCARSGAMLAHVRPLLSDAPASMGTVGPQELVQSVRVLLSQQGGRGAALEFGCDDALPEVRVDREVLHHVLQSLFFASLEGASAVSLRATADPDGVAFVIEDDGGVDEDPADWRSQVARGRPLLLAIAENILAKRGGRLDVVRECERTRISLVLPVA